MTKTSHILTRFSGHLSGAFAITALLAGIIVPAPQAMAKSKAGHATTQDSGETTAAANPSGNKGSMTAENPVFPAKIPAEFAALPAGRARMKACVAQYNANKENGGNAGLKWIQKGGGYWPQCNARLKDISDSAMPEKAISGKTAR